MPLLFLLIPGWLLAIFILFTIYSFFDERNRKKGMDAESIQREKAAERERDRKEEERWNKTMEYIAKPLAKFFVANPLEGLLFFGIAFVLAVTFL